MNKVICKDKIQSKTLYFNDRYFFSTSLKKDGYLYKKYSFSFFNKDKLQRRAINRFIDSYFIHSISSNKDCLNISSHNKESINYGLKIRTHIDKRLIDCIYNKYYDDRKCFLNGLTNKENIYINSSEDLTNYYHSSNEIYFNLKSKKELKPVDSISHKLFFVEEQFLYDIFDFVFQDKPISINASDDNILMYNYDNRIVFVNRGLENYVTKYIKMHNEKHEYKENSKVLQLKMEGI